MRLAGVGVRHADADRAAVVEPGDLARVTVRGRVRVDPNLDLTLARTLAST